MRAPSSILALISILSITHSQRTYDEAVCNGNKIYSFADQSKRGVMDVTTNPAGANPTFEEFSFTVTNTPTGKDPAQMTFESVSMDPTTGTIYALITYLPTTTDTYLATIDLDALQITLVNNAGPITPSSTILTGMTVDCDGTIYVVEDEEYKVYTVDPTTAQRTLVPDLSGSQNCNSPGYEDCVEIIGYHMDEDLIYRVSTSYDGTKFRIFRQNGDGTETKKDISDSNGYCLDSNKGAIVGIEYIGNDLWLISCEGDFGSVRLLDTQNFDTQNPTIEAIGSGGWVYSGGPVWRDGSGLIGSDSTGALCQPACVTTAMPTEPPTTPSPTTPSPTTPAPTTPSPTTPSPTTPSPTTPSPTTPAPTTPSPTTPSPTTPSPTTPSPTTPSPTTPAPGTPNPSTPSPTTPSPTTPAPTTPSPTTPSPTTPSPTTPSPTTPSPTTPAPGTPNPSTPSPTTPSPTTPSPTTPAPTNPSSTDDCPQCPFELDLDKISYVAITDDCPTTTSTPTTRSAQWNPNGGDSSDSSDRRRILKTHQSDSSEDMSDLCFKNGDSLVFVDDLCDTGWDKKKKQDSSDAAFLAPICVTYDVEEDTANCGTINNIFLGLCTSKDTDFDVSLLGTGDVDNILNVEDSVNVLSASGYRNADDELGVQVVLTRSNAMWFKICFENVAVTTTFNKERHDLDVATNGAIVFTDWSGDTAACTSLGLPCLNFFFGCEEDLIGPEKRIIASQKSIQLNANHNCDCDRGMTALTLRYVGDQTAASIVVYNARWRLILCTFTNVKKGEKITCTADNTKDGTFTRQTRFSVSYENRRRSLVDLNDIKNADCVGLMQTSCAVQIIGDKVIGCSDLVVVSHVDGDGALCNARILALETDNTANAYMKDYQMMYADPLKVLNELDPYIRWTLICIMITFVVLVFASIYICFVAKSRNLSEDDDEDDVLKSIAETKKHGLHTQTRTICRSISEEENMNEEEEEDEQNIILAVRNRLQMTTSFP
eukprot:338235_1